MEELKGRLAQETGIPPGDQILLIGPPFKQIKRLEPPLVFSSTSRDDRRLPSGTKKDEEKHIYLYNRRTVFDDTPAPEEVGLNVQLVDIPNASTLPPSITINNSSNSMDGSIIPLLKTLSQYERFFSLSLCRGNAYLERAKAVLEACVRGVEEQRIQRDAGDAALNNLMGYFDGIGSSLSSLLGEHQTQRQKNTSLLDSFEENLAKLQLVQLHPALGEALRENLRIDRASGTSVDCTAIRKATQGERVTLLDCVPVSRVRSWYEQCRTAFKHLDAFMNGLEAEMAQLRKGVDEHKGASLPVDLSDLARELKSLKGIVTEQEKRLLLLDRDYRDAVERIRIALQSMRSPNSSDGYGMEARQWLEAMKTRQLTEGGVLWALEQGDRDLLERASHIVNQKTRTSQWLFSGLRNISRLQSAIQSLTQNIKLGRMALADEGHHFSQLVHLEKLPDAYDAMLIEIARRQSYMKLFERKINHAIDDVANFRESEIQARSSFRKTHAVHLMPVFHQMFTSMADDPPHFQSRAMSFDQRLPNVRAEDLNKKEEDLMASYVACGRVGGGGEAGGVDGTLREESLIIPPAEAEPSSVQLEERCTDLEHQNTLLRAEIQRLTLAQKESQAHQQQQKDLGDSEGPVLVTSPNQESALIASGVSLCRDR